MNFEEAVAAWLLARGYPEAEVLKVVSRGYDNDGTFDVGEPTFQVVITARKRGAERSYDFDVEGPDMVDLWEFVIKSWPGGDEQVVSRSA